MKKKTKQKQKPKIKHMTLVEDDEGRELIGFDEEIK